MILAYALWEKFFKIFLNHNLIQVIKKHFREAEINLMKDYCLNLFLFMNHYLKTTIIFSDTNVKLGGSHL